MKAKLAQEEAQLDRLESLARRPILTAQTTRISDDKHLTLDLDKLLVTDAQL